MHPLEAWSAGDLECACVHRRANVTTSRAARGHVR